MANKKVYYFGIDLFQRRTGKKEKYTKFPDIIKDIVDNHSIVSGKINVLDVTMRGETLHSTVDIFRYKYDHMFMRTSRQKQSGSLIEREYKTHNPEPVLPGIDEEIKGIEIYTYIYIDYKKCILSIISNQGAPNQNVLIDIFALYSKDYDIQLVSVPNPDGIENIYGKEGTQINQLELCMTTPDPVILENIIGIDGNKLLEEATDEPVKITVQISSSVDRGRITKNSSDSDKLIEYIRNELKKFKKASVSGKCIGVKADKFNFYEENFHFPVDIINYKMESGKRIYLNLDEMANLYQDKLIGAYCNSKDFISIATQRKDSNE